MRGNSGTSCKLSSGSFDGCEKNEIKNVMKIFITFWVLVVWLAVAGVPAMGQAVVDTPDHTVPIHLKRTYTPTRAV